MVKFTVRQGEGGILPFRIKNRQTGRHKNLTGATFLLWVKRPEDDEPIIVKADADFDKAGVADGYVTVFIEPRDTVKEPWIYPGEVRIVTADNPNRTAKLRFELEILESLTPNDWLVQPTAIASLEVFGEAEINI